MAKAREPPIRLQQEIIKKTPDLTMFAWTAMGATIESGPSKGMTIPIVGDAECWQ